MLELTKAEAMSLAPLICDIKMNKEYGKLSQGHTYNWKKTAITQAYWKLDDVEGFRPLGECLRL